MIAFLSLVVLRPHCPIAQGHAGQKTTARLEDGLLATPPNRRRFRAPRFRLRAQGRVAGAATGRTHFPSFAGHVPARDGEAGSTTEWSGRKRSEEHTSEIHSLMRISYAVFCLQEKTKHMMIRSKQHTYMFTAHTVYCIRHMRYVVEFISIIF